MEKGHTKPLGAAKPVSTANVTHQNNRPSTGQAPTPQLGTHNFASQIKELSNINGKARETTTTTNTNAQQTSQSFDSSTKEIKESPESIMKDIKFADISGTTSFLSLLTAVWEMFGAGEKWTYRTHPITDFLAKIRQMAHYSIHAKPSDGETTIADDIRGDSSHNLAAVSLGIASYAYSAFVGPWMYIAKNLIGTSEKASAPAKLINRILTSVDEIVIPKVINLYWNIRRISKAMIPYTEKRLTSKDVAESHNKIKDTFSKVALYGLSTLPKWLLAPLKPFGLDHAGIASKQSRIKGDGKKMGLYALKSYFSNIAALRFGKYKPEDSNRELRVGEHDPETHPLFSWSRLLSQVLGLPMGLGGAIFNVASIITGVIGRVANIKTLDNLGFRLGYIGFALQTTLYATNEIPAHFHAFAKAWNQGKIDSKAYQSLGIFASGAAFALLAWIRAVSNSLLAKKLVGPFVRFFFAANRMKLHREEYKDAAATSLRSLVSKAEKIKATNPVSILLKILFRDPKFSYSLNQEEL